MADQYLLGAVVASILGFLLLHVGFHGWKGRARRTAGKCGSGPVVPGDGGTEVIIVGAGVAGSALAYALGKVRSSVSFVFSSFPNFSHRSCGFPYSHLCMWDADDGSRKEKTWFLRRVPRLLRFLRLWSFSFTRLLVCSFPVLQFISLGEMVNGIHGCKFE